VRAEVGPALLHLDEDEGLPDLIGESGAAAVFFGLANAELGFAADFEEAALAEGTEEAVEEVLRLALFVTRHVIARPLDEGGKALFAEGNSGLVKRLSRRLIR
jgi:hypothetical protein